MEVPELLWIKHQLDIIDDGGDVLQRSPLEHRNKKQLIRSTIRQVWSKSSVMPEQLKVECS